MRSFPWNSLIGATTPEGAVIRRLIQSTVETAVYEGDDSTILVIAPQEPTEKVLNRFREASFFNDPHLTKVLGTGTLEEHGLVYAITEPVEHTLAHYLSQRPLPEDDTRELTEQVASALAYLHSENFVFCNLRPEAVWRVGANWKLGDFSQLRVIGRGDSRELRATLARRLDLPPEVYEGLVFPAWDVWSVGVLLRRVLVPEPLHVEGGISTPRGRHLRQADLPAPFDAIARDCLEPDPNSRVSLDDLRARIQASQGHSRSSLPLEEAPSTGRERVGRIFGRLQGLTPAAKIGLVVFLAVLVLGIIASEAKMFRHGQSAVLPQPIPITVSEADRLKAPDPPELKSSPAPDAHAIRVLLDQYVASTRARDVRANLELYAPYVDTFYLRQGLTRDQLLIEKKRQFESVGVVYRYAVDNVKVVRPSRDIAVVSFDKKWSFGDRNPFSGAERAQLRLRNIEGVWKIVGEREVKVYWTHHGRA